MFRPRLVIVAVATFGLLSLAACGGGGTGFSLQDDPVVVTSTALPSMKSGQHLDHVIPLAGGCGGPYVLKVINGRLPDGLRLDQERHALNGHILENGRFTFTVQVTDTGCEPFSATTAEFILGVSVGEVVIVDALHDGVPSLAPAGSTPNNPDYPALPTVVYNAYNTIQLLVAGGVAPYRIDVVQDDEVPEAGSLPLGTSIPANSTTITGAAVELGPDDRPFVLVLRATDATGAEGKLAVQWRVDTPTIVIASDSLSDGVCGVPYKEHLIVSDGVPPFAHELVAAGLPANYTSVKHPESGDVVYNPGVAPTVNPAEALVKLDATCYPAEDAAGPDYRLIAPGSPPEGLRLEEESGTLSGVARRRGSFRIHYHVTSTLLPDAFGQHNWASYDVTFTEAAPLQQDPRYTREGAFQATSPYASIAAAEKGIPYNPDSILEPVAGLKLFATGGVAKDGWTDAPHRSQSQRIEGYQVGQEVVGDYDWKVDLDPDEDGGKDPIPAMELAAHVGLWRTTDAEALVPQQPQEVRFTALDQQLPLQARHEAPEIVNFEIGPDKVIFTESLTSYSGTGSTNVIMNDPSMRVRVLLPYSAGAQVRDLLPDDLSGEGTMRHIVPATAGSNTTPATLLARVDLHRVSVNPTGWWDDLHGLNTRSARTMQHGDRNAHTNHYGHNYHGSTTGGQPWNACQPSATSVDLPDCSAANVTHEPAGGIYTDGGQLYVFDSTTHFGVMIVRKDSSIYVPTAFEKSMYTNFGDNWNQNWSSGGNHSLMQIPQMTVSPDGRFASMKVRRTFSVFERADTTKIVIFSLTGERPAAWGGRPYQLIDTGSNGSWWQGEYQCASSLTLTNGHLYYIIAAGDTRYTSWCTHYIYRYDVLGGASAGAFLHPDHSPDWRNYAGQPMQSPFQRIREGFSEGTNRPARFTTARSGYNAHEVSLAPHPFRVSANGRACAILAGLNCGAGWANTNVQNYHVWVDYDGTMTRLSSRRRHSPQGGGRGTALRDGPETQYSLDYGSHSGPTSAFAISDDGLRVAVVVNRDTAIDPNRDHWRAWDLVEREDVIGFEPTNGTSWTGGAREIQITGSDTTTSNVVFSTPTIWRFGALTFTRDNAGLVFWGGFSAYRPSGGTDTTYGRYRAKSYVGSLFSFNFPKSEVKGILATADGGHRDGIDKVYTTSNRVAVTNSTWTTTGGVVKPIGGFISNNGDFRYIVNMGAVNSSRREEHQLIGVNIRSLDTSKSINGHTDGHGFLVAGMPSNRGFLPKYSSSTGSYSYAHYGIGSTAYNSTYPSYYGNVGPGGTWGGGLQVSAEQGGRVFFVTHYQRGSARAISQTSNGYMYGGPVLPTTHYDRGYYCGQVCVFDANVGGSIYQLTNTELGSNSSSVLRPLTYLEVSPDGSSVAVVYGTGTTHYYQERLANITGVKLNPTTGTLLNKGTVKQLATASSGRIGSAMAWGQSGGTVYYARGTSNERNKTLHADRTNPTGPGLGIDFGFDMRNYNVLHAGR